MGQKTSNFVQLINFAVLSPNAVELSVDLSWAGMSPCGMGNPEIRFSGVPEKTKSITIHMYDHEYRYDHGKVTIPYTDTENGIINKDRFKATAQLGKVFELLNSLGLELHLIKRGDS
jgi:hypothetical protein